MQKNQSFSCSKARIVTSNRKNNISGRKISKNDEVEILILLEKCTQIIKDDRNLLWQNIKDGNEEVENLLLKHKKKLDMFSLQQELRKLVIKIKAKIKEKPKERNLMKDFENLENNKSNLPKSFSNIKNSENNNISILPKTMPSIKSSQKKNDEIKSLFKFQQNEVKNQNSSLIQGINEVMKDVSNKINRITESIEKSEEKKTKAIFENKFNCENIEKANRYSNMIKNSSYKDLNSEIYEPTKINQNYDIKKYDLEDDQEKTQINSKLFFTNSSQEIKIVNSRNFEDSENKENNNLKQTQTENNTISYDNTIAMLNMNSSIQFSKPFELANNIILNHTPIKYDQKNNNSESKTPISAEKISSFTGEDIYFKCKAILMQKINEDQEIIREIKQLTGLDRYTAESIVKDIFSEPSLTKISKTYFRMKMESFTNLDKLNETSIYVVLNRLFELCDLKNDGFLDVNELGISLDFLCEIKEKDQKIRKFFYSIEQNGKDYLKLDELIKGKENLYDLLKKYFSIFDKEKKGLITYWDLFINYVYGDENLNKFMNLFVV